MIGDVAAVIMAAVRHDRIAVILAGLDQIELVAALGAHLDRPQPPVGREGEAEIVALAHRVELRRDAAAIGEWPARDRLPFRGQMEDLAEIAVERLRRVEFLPLARRQEDRPVGREGDAVGEMAVARRPWAPAAR